VSTAAPRFDRRKSDRRDRARAQPPDESWFGALGLSTSSTPSIEDGWAEAEEAHADAGWPTETAQGDAHFLSREARRIVTSGVSAFERIYAAFVAARAALGVALLSTQLVSELLGVRPRLLVTLICLAYAAETLTLWLLPRFRAGTAPSDKRSRVSRLSTAQWLSTIGCDVLCFAALHLVAPQSGLNYVALFVLPVLTAGVLTSRLAALACAATVALILLGNAWFGMVAGGDAALGITQAGLAGSGFFVITLLAGELASRLAREELTARGSLEFARQQAQLNRLVLEEMEDGVLVVDRKGKVRAANPAARSLLAPAGMARPAPFQLRGVEAWGPLVDAVERAFAEAVWPEAGRDVLLPFSPTMLRTLRLRVRFTRKRRAEADEDFCVLFIEDVRSVQARTRQERLAAMGRVSAGIAHEIRNPLAAIAQANALMAEDAIDPGQRRLTQMVSDNVERLKRIVDDVMELAPGDAQGAAVIDATATVLSICGEWARTANLVPGEASPLVMDMPGEALGAVFDPEHLRRVLVNLLDNARRHGREVPGSIVLRLSTRDDGPVVLSVASGGPVIPPEIERYLFEPFFSSRSRGTGLGLYICRELCERYGASIEYRQRAQSEVNRNEFVVMMRRETLQAPYGTPLRSLFT